MMVTDVAMLPAVSKRHHDGTLRYRDMQKMCPPDERGTSAYTLDIMTHEMPRDRSA